MKMVRIKDIGLNAEEKRALVTFRRYKCGADSLEAMDNEFAFRMNNDIPRELGFEEARKWLMKKRRG